MTTPMLPFATLADATSSVMLLVHHMFGLRTAFIAQTTENRFLAVAVQNQVGGCRLSEGTELPLEESY